MNKAASSETALFSTKIKLTYQKLRMVSIILHDKKP